ncbi:MAG: hypothetical protein ABSG78_24465 [Verrucomicrobiota bacterium]|jgi:hypothetical protein
MNSFAVLSAPEWNPFLRKFRVRVFCIFRGSTPRFPPLIRLILRLLLNLAENQLKCLSMKHLHTKPSIFNRAQSCQIVPNRAMFLNLRAHHPHVEKAMNEALTPKPQIGLPPLPFDGHLPPTFNP